MPGIVGYFRLIGRRRLVLLEAHVAQSVEHILGKDEVTSSILVMGSRIY